MDLFNSQNFSTHVDELMQKWHVPGLAIAVVQDQTIASRGYGLSSIDPQKPCTADSLFDMASSSKSLTAASVGLLVADDEKYPDVKWDAVMSKLLPDDFVMSQDSYTRDVTVEDVLSHRTGLPSHDFSYLGIHAAHTDTAQSVTRNLRNLAIGAPIRTKYMYCNLMYTVSTHLVEKTTGVTFEGFLHEHFFSPLDMSSSNLQPNAAIAAGLADRLCTPYTWHDDSRSYTPSAMVQSPEAQGAGSIITSVNDYIKWVKAVMHQEHPISEEIYRGLTKPRIFNNPDTPNEDLDPYTSFGAYAAGWEVRYYRGIQIIAHDGLFGGFGSSHFFLPRFKFGAVIVGNSESASELSMILGNELIDAVLNVPHSERPDWDKRAKDARAVYDASNAESLTKLKNELCPSYDGTDEPQKIPMSAYTGEYWNVGYHSLIVTIKDDHLFIDASDRSMVWYITLHHVCSQTIYVAELKDSIGEDSEYIAAEFRFESDRIVKMGINLEEDMEGPIWFSRVAETGNEQCV